MPRINRNDPAKLIRLALIGLDAQIAELRERRAQLATLINQTSSISPEIVAAPQKRRKLSAAARAKISAAAKARWKREGEAKAKALKPKKTPKRQPKAKSAKAPTVPAKAKKGKSA
jgi:hypothetical protein